MSEEFERKWREPFEILIKQNLDMLIIIYDNIDKLIKKTHDISVDMKKLRVFFFCYCIKDNSGKKNK
jgi:hypothetical protein